jgi:hypothetical protein
VKIKFGIPVFWISLFLLLSILSACNLAGTPQAPTPFPDSAYTAAAQTIVAQLTETALSVPPTTGPTAPPVVDTAEATTEAVTSTATQTATETFQPTDTPGVADTPTVTSDTGSTPMPLGELIFEDDFSDEDNWFVDSSDNFGFEYDRGGYQINVNILNATIWSIREIDSTDVQLEVDGQRTSGASDGYYGLLCRHQDEEESYYAMVVAEDGFYGIGKSEEGEFDFIETGTAASGVIQSDEDPNRVRADCIGESLTLYVNGQRLLEVQDDDFDSGFIGLVAGTRLSGDVTVLFDDLAVYEP